MKLERPQTTSLHIKDGSKLEFSQNFPLWVSGIPFVNYVLFFLILKSFWLIRRSSSTPRRRWWRYRGLVVHASLRQLLRLLEVVNSLRSNLAFVLRCWLGQICRIRWTPVLKGSTWTFALIANYGFDTDEYAKLDGHHFSREQTWTSVLTANFDRSNSGIWHGRICQIK